MWGLIFAAAGCAAVVLTGPFGVAVALSLALPLLLAVPDVLKHGVAFFPVMLLNCFLLGAAWSLLYHATALLHSIRPRVAVSSALAVTLLGIPAAAFLWMAAACEKASC